MAPVALHVAPDLRSRLDEKPKNCRKKFAAEFPVLRPAERATRLWGPLRNVGESQIWVIIAGRGRACERLCLSTD